MDGFDARFAVSQNGTLVYGAGALATTGTGSGQRLLVVDLEGNIEPLVLAPRSLRDVMWSPDGRSVVYESRPDGEADPHIFAFDVELGATPRQLTFQGSNVGPVTSSDGTRVVFSSQREGTDGSDLFVKRLDNDTPAELLITLPGAQLPTQWPSDTLIVFEWGPPPTDLWMLDLSDPDSPRAEAYLEQEANLHEIVVSPDGTLAAYGSDETGTPEIYIRSFPEAGERTLVSEGGGEFPRWSPDGNTIYYWTAREAGRVDDTFFAARIQRDPVPVVLSRDSLFTAGYFRPASDLHPDGDRLVVPQMLSQVADLESEVSEERFFVVTNFFEELRQRMGN